MRCVERPADRPTSRRPAHSERVKLGLRAGRSNRARSTCPPPRAHAVATRSASRDVRRPPHRMPPAAADGYGTASVLLAAERGLDLSLYCWHRPDRRVGHLTGCCAVRSTLPLWSWTAVPRSTVLTKLLLGNPNLPFVTGSSPAGWPMHLACRPQRGLSRGRERTRGDSSSVQRTAIIATERIVS